MYDLLIEYIQCNFQVPSLKATGLVPQQHTSSLNALYSVLKQPKMWKYNREMIISSITVAFGGDYALFYLTY